MDVKKTIEELPEVLDEIKEACARQKLVIFTGAGASRILGCSSWDSLSYDLVETCFKEGIINYAVKEYINGLKNNKKIITICSELLKEKGKYRKFKARLRKALKPDPNKLKSINLYEYLRSLGAIYVTTNADEVFDNHFPSKNVFDLTKKYPDFHILSNRLYHIHGMLKNNSTIFTANDYIKLYDKQYFLKFLSGIFNEEYVVLFIGYGLSEFELLDYIIPKLFKKGSQSKKYSLEPYKGNEYILKEIDQKYFNDLNVEIIPYNYEQKGYEQLFYVIQKWATELRDLGNYSAYLVDELSQCIINFNKDTAEKLVKQMEKETFLRDEFFKTIHNSPEPDAWFELLLKYGILWTGSDDAV